MDLCWGFWMGNRGQEAGDKLTTHISGDSLVQLRVPSCFPLSMWPSSPRGTHTVTVTLPQASDSDYEDALPKHSFVNHYMSDPTYYNSWKRRPPAAAPHRYEAVAGAEAGQHPHPVITTQSAGGVYTPAGPGARAPLTGFSSFV